MFGLLDHLRSLEQAIKIGIVGIGSIGRGMVLQSNLTPKHQYSKVTSFEQRFIMDSVINFLSSLWINLSHFLGFWYKTSFFKPVIFSNLELTKGNSVNLEIRSM